MSFPRVAKEPIRHVAHTARSAGETGRNSWNVGCKAIVQTTGIFFGGLGATIGTFTVIDKAAGNEGLAFAMLGMGTLGTIILTGMRAAFGIKDVTTTTAVGIAKTTAQAAETGAVVVTAVTRELTTRVVDAADSLAHNMADRRLKDREGK